MWERAGKRFRESETRELTGRTRHLTVNCMLAMGDDLCWCSRLACAHDSRKRNSSSPLAAETAEIWIRLARMNEICAARTTWMANAAPLSAESAGRTSFTHLFPQALHVHVIRFCSREPRKAAADFAERPVDFRRLLIDSGLKRQKRPPHHIGDTRPAMPMRGRGKAMRISFWSFGTRSELCLVQRNRQPTRDWMHETTTKQSGTGADRTRRRSQPVRRRGSMSGPFTAQPASAARRPCTGSFTVRPV